ncbi:glucose-6-phosphate isomerase [Sandarakinorhabdus sp.]|uniref:glucose-6-phosphate isomerase n=1 Tax=Sandarakinorhabdus sp. TaxID=1916663 RepID=UPI00286DEE78|nr:glucose-6-phosphate isomerase [Sandarakinorhabdus sp.]
MTVQQRLRTLAASSLNIAGAFAADPDRLARLSVDVAGIHADLSKLAVTPEILDALLALAQESDVAGWRAKLFAGEIVNPSEGRSATHVAERGLGPGAANAAAATAHADMLACANRLRADGTRYLVHIGIGGSGLGPALLVDALGRDGDGPAIEIVANVDGEALSRALSRCDPAHTSFAVVSKTFTTTETLTNATSARAWLAAAGIADSASRFIGITAAPERAQAWGVGEVLAFAPSVGGRYSLWSAVGLPLAVRCGPAAFADLLAGAAAMDRHFLDAPMARNLPVLAGMADVWAARYCRQPVRGVFAYDERLRLLPAYLQQLEMESNGKSVTRDGAATDRPTAAITWGGTGTDAQHAVFQLLHQGSVIGPTEFLAVRTPGHDMTGSHHRQLLANCLAQGAALMCGRTLAEALVLAGGDAALAAAKTFTGNRPSATLLLDRLDARTLGALIAFYEHRVFVAAALMGINPFDQWGVELGKELAIAALSGAAPDFDPSTRDLMARAGL